MRWSAGLTTGYNTSHMRMFFHGSLRNAIAIFLVIAFGVGLAPQVILSQTEDQTAAKEAQLQKELNDINQEIAGLNNTIGGLQSQGVSLDRDIKLLSATIARANLNIKAKNIEISKLAAGITEKVNTVRELTKRIERERESLAQLVRKTNELDQAGIVEVLLSGEDLSEFFVDLDSFDALRGGLRNSTEALKSAKTQNISAQTVLEERQRAEMDAKAELERNKRLVEAKEKEKANLLAITKNQEKEYSKVLAARKKRATEIRTALFALRDSGEIPFGRALEYANLVSAKTGIRPAFLLAIFQQESSFGKNQGSCYVKNQTTGAGVGVKSGNTIARVMNPTRDIPPFLLITKELGRDPWNTLVSCPQDVGWGGAMGAAQFIPSTWVLFKERITSTLGTATADPWSARDAFMAAGLYLSDLGARSSSYSSERNAACKYFSGRSCANSSWAATYGNQVMQKAATIQETMIDPLQNT